MQSREQLINQATRRGYNQEGIRPAANTSLEFLRDYVFVQGANQLAFVQYRVPQETPVQRFPNDQTGVRNYRVQVSGTRRTLHGVTAGVRQFFTNVLQHAVSTEQLLQDDQILIVLMNRVSRNNEGRLSGPRAISIPMVRVRDFNVETIMNRVEQAMQSDTTFDLIRSTVTIKYVRVPRGGRFVIQDPQMQDFISKKRSIVQVNSSTDDDCFWRCVNLGLHEDDKIEFKKLYQAYRSLTPRENRGEVLIQLANQCGLDFGEMVSLADIPIIERELNVTLVIVNLRSLLFIYNGSGGPDRTILTLGFLEQDHTGHYFYIRRNKLGSLFDRRYFCFTCMKAVSNKGHRCPGTAYCKACKREECMGREHKSRHDFKEYCERCNMHYFDKDCIRVHKCSHRRCADCEMVYKLPKKGLDKHVCYQYQCNNCNQSVSLEHPHQCTMQKCHDHLTANGFPKLKNKGMIVYDFECTLGGETHEPALIVAAYGKDQSYEDTEFFSFDTVARFMNWVLQPAHKGFIVLAHNAGRYDIHFIKQWGLKNHIAMDDLVKGNRFIQTTFTKFHVKFMDTLQFLPFALRKFPKAFRIEERTKGYFPYRFYTKQTMNYKGNMPGAQWFDFDRLSTKERETALQWYVDNQFTTIDLAKMCLEYCKSDVYLLMIGAVKFQQEILELTGLDPYENPTIASSAMRIYKFHDMPEHSIGLFTTRSEDSLEERLLYQQYALQFMGGTLPPKGTPEVVVAFRELNDQKEAYVYFPCIDHGCPKCTKAYQIHPFKFVKMTSLYSHTKVMIRRLKEQGLKLKVMWGCQFRNKQLHELQFKELSLPEELKPLKLHDAFFGGRTEPFALYYRAQENERIEYVDFTSLYPSIQSGKNRSLTDPNVLKPYPYPIGHPVYVKEVAPGSLCQYFGFAKVRIRPPQDLHIPLLPSRGEGRLLFDLKPKIGTWTTIELQKAVQLGYVIEHVYEVAHFEQQTTELFSSYVKRFFRCKTEAGGLAKLGVTADDTAWIDAYNTYHGIDLDVTHMETMNAPKYLVSKLYCNSLWGKFAQKDNQSNSKDVFNRDELCELIFDPTVIVVDLFFHDEDARTVIWKRRQEYKTPARNTNLAVAAYTTAHARLRLYEALEAYGSRALYCDTDSVIAVQPMDQPRPVHLGSYLGDLQSELDDDEWIVEFVATAPKSYAYRTNKGQEVVHVKGFTLNHETGRLIDFDAMRQLVGSNDPECVIETRQLRFMIDEHHQVRTDPDAKKLFKYTFMKRQRLDDQGDFIGTVPFSE